ncbi:MAG: oxygenase MpaB family protein [Pedobacter sp.]|nr:oxygenase MpaB family protein [Pedobacter sp.]
METAARPAPSAADAPAKPIPKALGPDSLAWQHAGDNLQLLMAGTTLVLQVAHPVVGAGVGDHSVFKKDPWGRLKRTTDWGLRLLYGGPVKAPIAGQALRDMHRNIKGQDDKGRRYFALDPEAYAWVHMTTYYAMITTQKLFAKQPFTALEEIQLYEEWLQQGRVLGIRDADMPADVSAFWDYFDNMVRNRLEDTDTARYLLDVSLTKVKKPPQLKLLPTSIWDAAYAAGGSFAKLACYATMPDALRAKYGVVWDEKAQKRFRRMQRVVKAGLPLLPDKIRYMLPAYEALKGIPPHYERKQHERTGLAA